MVEFFFTLLKLFFKFTGEMLGALCTRKGPDIYVPCREEILKSVSDNLERKLPDSEELTGGLMHKLTGGENDTSQETVRIQRLRMLVIDLSSVTLSLPLYIYVVSVVNFLFQLIFIFPLCFWAW